jgi:hypothetical protein
LCGCSTVGQIALLPFSSIMVFIDLEKAYDKVPRNIMWWTLQKHKVSTKYIILIKDMYDNVVTSV